LRVLIGFNDLKSQRPDIACEHADYLKSGKAWWRGFKCGHAWERMESSGLKRWKEVN